MKEICKERDCRFDRRNQVFSLRKKYPTLRRIKVGIEIVKKEV